MDVSLFVAKPHLDYMGGKILNNPKFVSIYLGSYWGTKKGKAEAKYLDDFGKNIVKSRYTTIWNEYGVNKGKFLGSVSVTNQRNPKYINDAELQKTVWSLIRSKKVPTEDGQTVYSVFLPPGTVLVEPEGLTSLDGLGGYHGSFRDSKDGLVYYSGIVYSDKKNGIDFTGKSLENVTITTSHEWTEAATDPDVMSGKLGWYDQNYGEVADIPMNMGLPIKDLYGYIDGYAVQKEWSNKDKTVELVGKTIK